MLELEDGRVRRWWLVVVMMGKDAAHDLDRGRARRMMMLAMEYDDDRRR